MAAEAKKTVKKPQIVLAKTGSEQIDAKIREVELRMLPIGRNAEGYGYSYPTLTLLLSHVNRALDELGLVWSAWADVEDIAGQPVPVFIVRVTDLASGQYRQSKHLYPKSTYVALNIPQPTQQGSRRKGNPDIAAGQKVGAFETYCRRYSLVSILGIPIKDTDGQPASQAPRQPRSARYARR